MGSLEAQIVEARTAAYDALDRLLTLYSLEWDRLDRHAAWRISNDMRGNALDVLWGPGRTLGISRRDLLDAAVSGAICEAYDRYRPCLEATRKRDAQQLALAA
jgi:hypothetical protein